MKFPILIIALTLFLFSCRQTNREKIEQEPFASMPDDSLRNETLPPLPEGEVSLTDAVFGEIIELQGTPHPVDQIFKIKGCEMIALDSLLIVKNMGNEDVGMVFSLPDFKFLKSFGKFGKGPGEFLYPTLVEDESRDLLCYIYEQKNDHLYALTRNFELIEASVELRKREAHLQDKQLYGISSKEFLYIESTKTGKALFHTDSTRTVTELINLAFSPTYNNWAAYIGYFGVNIKYKRTVFAYKLFKRLVFYDLENKTSKTVSFDTPTKTKKGDAVSLLDPSNIAYYCGISAQSKYVYVLYSGRSVADAIKQPGSGYIYVEKFDWNGNPVSKYRLDHRGFFCVDEMENTLYLASSRDDQPFFSYKLSDH